MLGGSGLELSFRLALDNCKWLSIPKVCTLGVRPARRECVRVCVAALSDESCTTLPVLFASVPIFATRSHAIYTIASTFSVAF